MWNLPNIQMLPRESFAKVHFIDAAWERVSLAEPRKRFSSADNYYLLGGHTQRAGLGSLPVQ